MRKVDYKWVSITVDREKLEQGAEEIALRDPARVPNVQDSNSRSRLIILTAVLLLPEITLFNALAHREKFS